MYQFSVHQPNGDAWYELFLDPENRWVKQAHRFPWQELGKTFPDVLSSFSSQYDDPLRLALCFRLIQVHYSLSHAETLCMIQENPYLQYFCGFSAYCPTGLAIQSELLSSFDALEDSLLERITHFCALHMHDSIAE